MFSGFTKAITCAVVDDSKMERVSDIIIGLVNDLALVDVKQGRVFTASQRSQAIATTQTTDGLSRCFLQRR
jgi:hypothetical protein